MEKLNEYLKELLSTCSEELHLEPDKRPYLVSSTGSRDIAKVALLGTQISMMVFPLIPPDTKAALPHSSEVEFVHPHSLGTFNFAVQKSPAGFHVTVRPILGDSGMTSAGFKPLPAKTPDIVIDSPFLTADPEPELQVESASPSFVLERQSAGVEYNAGTLEAASFTSELLLEEMETAAEYSDPGSEAQIEILPVNDPEYSTVFSDNAEYEPPARRDDWRDGEYIPLTIDTPQPDPAPQFEAAPLNEPTMTPIPQSTPPPQPVQSAFVPAPSNSVMSSRMDALFNKMSEIGASDLHLSVSVPPMIRKDGKMMQLVPGMTPLTDDATRDMLTSIMPERNQEEFGLRSDTDFAYEIPGLARFRCNVFMDRKGMGGVFRVIPSKILTAEQLGLSKAIMDLCSLSKGLVVVTGPTGSGKSTTLCAMVDAINKDREDHIITIEDPIEFVHENQKCLVNQREVHNHTDSFKDALRAALREDPDIVLVGEMRDLETVSIAIETAETGHLVFGTLHTTTAASTVDRIIDQFPADRQQQIRVMLSESLKGVISQTLLPKKGGGRVAALEVLIITPAISNLIREGKVFQIPSAMQTGKNVGMVMLNDALFEHVQNGIVEPMDAYIKAVDKTAFETMLTRGGYSL